MSTIIPTNFVPLDEQVLMVVFHDTAVDMQKWFIYIACRKRG